MTGPDELFRSCSTKNRASSTSTTVSLSPCVTKNGMFAHPGDHLLDVDYMIGELRGRAQAVVRADAYPALAREPIQEGTCLAALPAAAERSAVQVDERRTARGTRAMAVDVEQIQLARVAVADVRNPLDIATAEEEGPRRGCWRAEGGGAGARPALGRDRCATPNRGPRSGRGRPRGPACNARQATITSPTVARAARPRAIHPTGEAMSLWAMPALSRRGASRRRRTAAR